MCHVFDKINKLYSILIFSQGGKKLKRKLLAVVLSLALILSLGSVSFAAEKKFEWTFVSSMGPSLVQNVYYRQLCQEITKRSNGALHVEFLMLGEHPYSSGEMLSVIRDGLAQMGQGQGLYVTGEEPLMGAVDLAFMMPNLEKAIKNPLPDGEKPVCRCVSQVLPGIRMMLSKSELKTLKVRNNKRIAYFSDHIEHQADIVRPFTPDEIVYCKSNYIFLNDETPEAVLEEAQKVIPAFTDKLGYQPKVILIKGIGLVAVGDNAGQCDIILDVFEDAMKVAYLAHSFGGPHPMTQEQIDFIDNWEVENYRRSVSAGISRGRAENKTIVITGAAQGFGEGIGRCLLQEGANIVIADLNEEVGKMTAEKFNTIVKSNRAFFVKTNVVEIASLENLIHETVCQFGAIDCFISNAGVLRAGGLDDMTPENFDFVTKINYSAYFYCTKIVSKVMKLQTKYAYVDYYADIIQINSKSGLQGSKANFAYAGGKFGGIGLTQSFALELAPDRIKVNAICPGNFYEGPLWSDPENGLFVQYLKAGKVPGAKTIEDVKAFYLSKVPMGKGCTPEDVTKGVLYLMEQCGETGQALPITGGQVMLS